MKVYILVIILSHILGSEDIFSSVGTSKARPIQYSSQSVCGPSAVVSFIKNWFFKVINHMCRSSVEQQQYHFFVSYCHY